MMSLCLCLYYGTLSENYVRTLMKAKELMIHEGVLSPQEAAKMIVVSILTTFKTEPNNSCLEVKVYSFDELKCPNVKKICNSKTTSTSQTNNINRIGFYTPFA